MPINEILAPAYSIMHYRTTTHNRLHSVRLYFDEVPVLDTGDDEWVFPSYIDAAHTTGWSLNGIWDTVIARMNDLLTNLLPAFTVVDVEVWKSEDGINTFLGYDPDDYTPITGGGGTSIAAAYVMSVTRTALKKPFRLTFMDTADARPQRYQASPPPDADNDTINWFLVKSAVRFTNQDGERLVLTSSHNTGYNRKLARSYGRLLTP